MYEMAGADNCLQGFQCHAALNAATDMEAFRWEARRIAADYEGCPVCTIAQCFGPGLLEARCDEAQGRCVDASSRCSLRKTEPSSRKGDPTAHVGASPRRLAANGWRRGHGRGGAPVPRLAPGPSRPLDGRHGAGLHAAGSRCAPSSERAHAGSARSVVVSDRRRTISDRGFPIRIAGLRSRFRFRAGRPFGPHPRLRGGPWPAPEPHSRGSTNGRYVNSTIGGSGRGFPRFRIAMPTLQG